MSNLSIISNILLKLLSLVEIVKRYAQEQGLWVSDDIVFTDTLKLDMSTVVPTISGPKRPQDKVLLTEASKNFDFNFKDITKRESFSTSKVDGTDYEIKDGSVLIAAITSCTNTSNPNVLIGAGLLAIRAFLIEEWAFLILEVAWFAAAVLGLWTIKSNDD